MRKNTDLELESGDVVVLHQINTEMCGSYKFKETTGGAKCDGCGGWISSDEVRKYHFM